MRIKGWHIEGFGIFNQYAVDNLSPKLNLFVGPNEAGKSTLLDYLRFMLFGFPRQNQKSDSRRKPLNGGRHGGRLFLEGDNGILTVQRFSESKPQLSVVFPDGSDGTDEDLRYALGGADSKVFNSVFAFNLSDLSSFDTLNSDGVRERIFSAGIAGAGQSAHQVIKELLSRNVTLLRPKKEGAKINALTKELEALAAEAAQAREKAEHHPVLLAEEKTAREELLRLRAALETAYRERSRYKRVLELWKSFCERKEAECELSQLAETVPFPDGAEGLLTALLCGVEQARKQSGELLQRKEQQSKLQSEVATSIDQKVLELALPLEESVQRIELQRARLLELPVLRQQYQQQMALLEQSLRELGSDWTIEKVRTLDTSLPRRDDVRRFESRINTQAEASKNRSQDLSRLNDELRVFESEANLQKKMIERLSPPDKEKLIQQETALKHLRNGIVTQAALEAKLIAQKDILARVEQFGALSPAPRSVELAAGAVGIAVFLAALWRATLNDFSTGIVLFIASLFPFAFLLQLRLLRARPGGGPGSRKEEVSTLQRELKRLQSELEDVAGENGKLTQMLFLPARSSLLELDQKEAQLKQARTNLDRAEDGLSKIAALELRIADHNERISEAEQQLAQLRSEENKTAEDWARWLNEFAIPYCSGPQGARILLEEVGEAKKSLQQAERIQEKLELLEAEVFAWEETVRNLLVNSGRASEETALLGGEGLVQELLTISGQAKESIRAGEKLADLNRELRELEGNLAVAREEQEIAEAKLQELYRSVRAESEHEFRLLLKNDKRRDLLLETVRSLTAQLTERVGTGPDAELIWSMLAQGERAKWEEELERLTRAVDGYPEEIQAAERKLIVAEREREELEKSANVASLENRLSSLQAELEYSVKQWKINQLAKRLVEETLLHFTRNRQPAVLAEASRTFHQVTKRYQSVFHEDGNQSLTVFDVNGEKKTAEMLSRGTAEQLYLCVRLGLAAELAKRTSPLPLIMDDVLVNFDEERAQAIVQMLDQFSKNNQILLFTCHPWTEAIVRKAAPDVQVSYLTRQAK